MSNDQLEHHQQLQMGRYAYPGSDRLWAAQRPLTGMLEANPNPNPNPKPNPNPNPTRSLTLTLISRVFGDARGPFTGKTKGWAVSKT